MRDFRDIYRDELALEAQWLRLCAVAKVDSIEVLLRDCKIEPITVLELGCGTGSVILECQRRKLGAQLSANDFSEDAIRYLRAHSHDVECHVADITAPEFELLGRFDVVIVSHVLEHLDEPLAFLESLRNKIAFRYLVVEVPLEDLPASRLKALFRDRRNNAAGHVQFFTADSFKQLVRAARLVPIRDRRYVPILSREVVRFLRKRNGSSWPRTLITHATGRWLPRIFRPLWMRLYYAHHTLVCEAT